MTVRAWSSPIGQQRRLGDGIAAIRARPKGPGRDQTQLAATWTVQDSHAISRLLCCLTLTSTRVGGGPRRRKGAPPGKGAAQPASQSSVQRLSVRLVGNSSEREPHKNLHQVRVELRAGDELQQAEGGIAVDRPVAGAALRHGVERIGDGQDA